MADWQWVIGPASGGHDKALTAATSRKVTFRLATPSDAGFSIDGRTEAAAAISELATDLHVIRDGKLLDRMRIGPSSDEIGDDTHVTQVTALDYREVLNRRRLYTGDQLAWVSIDQAQIAWDLVSITQAKPGGQLDIVQGTGFPGGAVQSRNYEAGDSIGEKVQELSQVVGGFDWAITPDGASSLRLDIWPQRGANRGVVLEHGGLVAKVSRQFDPGTYANAVILTGDTSAVPPVTQEVRTAADIGARPEGRWDAVYGTDTKKQAELAQRADWQLATSQVVQPAWTLTLKAGAWGGPGHIWLGDTVQLVVRSGRVSASDLLRVFEIGVALDQDGAEAVTVTVGAARPEFRFRASQIVKAIEKIKARPR